MRAIQLNVVDREGQPIDDLTVSGKLYHHAMAGELIDVKMKSVGKGDYLSLAPAGRRGIWQLELSIDGADDVGHVVAEAS